MKGFGRRARDCGVTNAVNDLASVDDTVDLFKLRRQSIEDTKTDDVRVRLCLKTMKMDLACRCALHYSVYRKPNSKVLRLNVSLYPREDIHNRGTRLSTEEAHCMSIDLYSTFQLIDMCNIVHFHISLLYYVVISLNAEVQ